MKLTRANAKAIKYACLHFHYAKAIPVNTLGYNVYNDDGEWCGVILFGTGATPNMARPYGLTQGEVLELVRVALNGKQECTSKAVGIALRLLKKDCPMCKMVVSYADCDQSHYGTIYQATNWIFTGVNKAGCLVAFMVHGKKMHPKSVYARMVVIDGKRQHCPQTIEAVRRYIDPNATVFKTQGKRKYLFPMTKQMRKQLEPLAKPYPKKTELCDNEDVCVGSET